MRLPLPRLPPLPRSRIGKRGTLGRILAPLQLLNVRALCSPALACPCTGTTPRRSGTTRAARRACSPSRRTGRTLGTASRSQWLPSPRSSGPRPARLRRSWTSRRSASSLLEVRCCPLTIAASPTRRRCYPALAEKLPARRPRQAQQQLHRSLRVGVSKSPRCVSNTGKPQMALARNEFIDTFDFTNNTFVQAMRAFLGCVARHSVHPHLPPTAFHDERWDFTPLTCLSVQRFPSDRSVCRESRCLSSA